MNPTTATVTIVIEADMLSIGKAAELKATLSAQLAEKKPLILCLKNIQLWDTSGLQLLVATAKEAAAKGVTLAFEADDAGELWNGLLPYSGLHYFFGQNGIANLFGPSRATHA